MRVANIRTALCWAFVGCIVACFIVTVSLPASLQSSAVFPLITVVPTNVVKRKQLEPRPSHGEAVEISAAPQITMGKAVVDNVAFEEAAPTRPSGAMGEICPRVSKKYMSQFHLNAFLANKKESVEVQIFRAFGSLLDVRCQQHAAAITTPRPNDPLGYFVDIGGNNGVDVGFWLSRFGGCDSPCGCGVLDQSTQKATAHQGLHFVVFEPQDQYQAGLNGMAEKRLATMSTAIQRPLTVLHAAVGKESQHDTNLSLVGDGEQGVVDLEGNFKANGKPRRIIQMKALGRVLRTLSTVDPTPPVVALKVDAEGADATLLVASSDLFSTHRVDFIIFELNKNVKFFEVGYGQAVSMLREAGYRTFMVGVARAGARGSLTYIAIEVGAALIGRMRISLETIIALSPSMVATMHERAEASGRGSELFGAVGANGRRLLPTDPLLGGLSTGCYYSAYAWEGPPLLSRST